VILDFSAALLSDLVAATPRCTTIRQKRSFSRRLLEPQITADKRGFHGFLISVHLRPSAVPFLVAASLLYVIADLQGLKCGDSHVGYCAPIGIGFASDYDPRIHGFLLSTLCWLTKRLSGDRARMHPRPLKTTVMSS
jgi:hypothetical protein